MSAGCNSCGPSACETAEHHRSGGPDRLIALAGNPNTGKSTVFNALTGLRQHTGNWPGKTVTRAEGSFTHGGRRFRLIDLPGTYSLSANSVDEQIARDFIWFGGADVVVVVVDSTCLERNLHLVLQILEVTRAVVVCLNLQDEARRKGIAINAEALSADLGVPVIPTVARTGRGLAELRETLLAVETNADARAPVKRLVTYGSEVEAALEQLTPLLREACPDLENPRWVALRMLHGDQSILEAIPTGQLTRIADEPGFVQLAAS
ncbi:MAG: iron transporter FeoB [bacterium]|nr:iron transporter FeoB [bacterium]